MAESEARTVSFRFPAELSEFGQALQLEASKRGMKANEYARNLVIGALSNTAQDEFREELEKLRSQVKKGREDLAKLAILLLTTSRTMGTDEARAVVSRVLSQ
jgi:hypothetical protein